MSEQLARDVAKLETEIVLVQAELKNLAHREWVTELIKPIERSVVKIENAITTLSDRVALVFDAQSKSLTETAKAEKEGREREEKRRDELHQAELKALESKTFGAMLKNNWQPALAFIAVLFIVCGGIGTLVMSWFTHYVLPQVK